MIQPISHTNSTQLLKCSFSARQVAEFHPLVFVCPRHESSRQHSRYSPKHLSVRAAVSTAERPAVTNPGTSVASQPSGQHGSAAFGEPQCGRPEPLGATYIETEGAVNFALYSANSTSAELCFFTEQDLRAGRVSHSIELDSTLNRTGDVWHVQIPGVATDLLYGYRMGGLHQDSDRKAAGHRFSPTAVVLDPYAQAIMSRRSFGELGPDLDYQSPHVLGLAATWPQAACSLPGPRHESLDFDWEGDQPLHLPMEDLIIYEMHVRGFTRDKSSGVAAPGTYTGLVEKLDYIQKLGVNAIELLPVHEFNELEYYQLIPGSDQYRFNYWGYSTVGFFAPMARYSQAALEGRSGAAIVAEFKTMVKECHKRGIEVILDVVFNHTAEGNDQGPTISFRGLDNRVYYMLAPEGEHYNYSGCGNTFNCNHPQVRRFILDCLRYWVLEMHVDGFRFDLASIMTRAPSVWHRDADGDAATLHCAEPPALAAAAATAAPVPARSPLASADAPPKTPPDPLRDLMPNGPGVPTGTPLSDPALVEMISEDPVLRDTKLIAEAWDCDGLNQVGAFPHYGGRWSEWNGHFRDTARMFVKGTEGPWASAFASALCGSPDIYAAPPGENDWWGNGDGRKWRGGRGPTHSVNFITAHDGFSLADLVAFNSKHNDANGEGNRDGESNNLTWNCGAEGPTSDLRVQRLRARQQRNLAAALLLSQGVPMILMGDEYGHSKGGNNNTYCHDTPLNWFNWGQAAADETGFARFFRLLVNLRRQRPELRQRDFVGPAAIQWHGVQAGSTDWSEASRLVAFTLSGPSGGLYIAFNSSHLPTTVQLPDWYGRQWQPLVDTGKVAPYDFLQADEQLSKEEMHAVQKDSHLWVADGLYPLLPWSCCVLDSVPWDTAPSHAPYSSVLPISRAPSKKPQKASRSSSNGHLSAARKLADEISQNSQGPSIK